MEMGEHFGGCGCACGMEGTAQSAWMDLGFFRTRRWCFIGVRVLLVIEIPRDEFLGNVGT